MALLATLVLIFAFQGQVILGRLSHIVLIAIPLLIQVYFNSGLAYGLARWFRVPHAVAAPGALIGASNFFELAVATAISLFGLTSGATLATVVGRARRGAGDAVGVLVLQPDAPLVRRDRRRRGAWGPGRRGTAMTRRRVLFLCTHNSARSRMAEGFLRALAGEAFEVASAGTEATRVHPLAMCVMGEVGIDIRGHTSKTVDGLLDHPWNYVITVCDRANERCRSSPAGPSGFTGASRIRPRAPGPRRSGSRGSGGSGTRSRGHYAPGSRPCPDVAGIAHHLPAAGGAGFGAAARRLTER